MIHPILLRLSVAIYWSVRHLFYMYHMMKMTECGNFYAEKHTKQMKITMQREKAKMTIGLSESDNFKFIELNKSELMEGKLWNIRTILSKV